MKKVFAILIVSFLVYSPDCFANPATFEICFSPSDTVKVELVFGRKMPDNKVVKMRQWKQFTRDVVTPRFPYGFTVVHGKGQWKEEHEIIREPSEILMVVGVLDTAMDQKIEEIIQLYKTRFRQQAVLRIDTKVSYRIR